MVQLRTTHHALFYRSPCPTFLQQRPDLWWRDRDIDMAHAKVPQRVYDRIGDRRRRADRGTLPYSLGTEGVVGRRCDSFIGLPARRLDRRGQQVVHKGAGDTVALVIIDDLLIQ